ncbi:MAG: glycosyltransferase family 4 protein [Armatimonadetes bacterium]|nr:glycosyltransferase family 4 protein [Armatimonadota bacterium]
MPRTVLYLYTEIAPYNIAVFRHLTQDYDACIEVVHWDKGRQTPYVPSALENVRYHKRSALDARRIAELANEIRPDIAYVSGWQDPGYLQAARMLRKRRIPVVVGFDDQWFGTLRQQLGTLVYRLHLASCFSHAWVTGPRQYEYARRFGFRSENIIYDLYSGDVRRFGQCANALRTEPGRYPTSFLYVGRFAPAKAIDILGEGYRLYRESAGAPWDLLCVGNGPMKADLVGAPGVEIREFSDQSTLMGFASTTGAFVLPSRHEPWGVVVHEFAAAGLPLLLSTAVGAGDLFLIHGYNGFRFPAGSAEALAAAMVRLSALSCAELIEMGRNSRRLAARIDPTTSSANLMALVR